jgi:hypothetical protein
MMNYPKRNIAQNAPDSRKKKKPVVVVHSPPPPKKQKSTPSCPGATWNDVLYPSELWQMYEDLDKITYQRGRLSDKERDEIQKRMPSSLRQAEDEADQKLFEFVQNAINTKGVKTYSDILKRAMTGDAQALLALRCYAASTAGIRIRDVIQIFNNKAMNSHDFFPGSCQRTGTDPQTGKSMTYVVDRPESDDDPYWRSQNHKSTKHRMVRRLATDPKPTKRDKMPPSLANQMAKILAGFGIRVTSNEEAWEALSERSRAASIEDRIVARIAYLIMNATVHQDNKLGGPPPKMLPP